MTLTESACGMDINCRPAEQLKGVVAMMRLKRGCEPNIGIHK